MKIYEFKRAPNPKRVQMFLAEKKQGIALEMGKKNKNRT